MSKNKIIADTEFEGTTDTVDATNKAAIAGGTAAEIAKASVGNWEELGFNALASSYDNARVLGEANREASITVGSLHSAENIPDSGWNDPEYWPVFDSVNYDSYLAGGFDPGAYVAVVAPPVR